MPQVFGHEAHAWRKSKEAVNYLRIHENQLDRVLSLHLTQRATWARSGQPRTHVTGDERAGLRLSWLQLQPFRVAHWNETSRRHPRVGSLRTNRNGKWRSFVAFQKGPHASDDKKSATDCWPRNPAGMTRPLRSHQLQACGRIAAAKEPVNLDTAYLMILALRRWSKLWN